MAEEEDEYGSWSAAQAEDLRREAVRLASGIVEHATAMGDFAGGRPSEAQWDAPSEALRGLLQSYGEALFRYTGSYDPITNVYPPEDSEYEPEDGDQRRQHVSNIDPSAHRLRYCKRGRTLTSRHQRWKCPVRIVTAWRKFAVGSHPLFPMPYTRLRTHLRVGGVLSAIPRALSQSFRLLWSPKIALPPMLTISISPSTCQIVGHFSPRSTSSSDPWSVNGAQQPGAFASHSRSHLRPRPRPPDPPVRRIRPTVLESLPGQPEGAAVRVSPARPGTPGRAATARTRRPDCG